MIYIALMLFLFFPKQVSAECGGHYKCALYDKLIGCDTSFIVYTLGCPGTNEADCEGGVGYAACTGQCYINETCSWTDPCYPDCDCASWTCNWTSCNDGCGGTCTGLVAPSCTWSGWSPSSCGPPYCGVTQTRTANSVCGGTCSGSSTNLCSNADNGVPNVPAYTTPAEGAEVNAPVTIGWTTGGSLTDYYEYSLNGGTAVNVGNVLSTTVTALPGANNFKVRSVNTSCGTDTSNWSDPVRNFCYERGAVPGAWTACNASHKRTRSCTEDCGTDDCASVVQEEDCVGTITGTLFDASDLSSCPADIGTNAVYSPIRIKNQTFSITHPSWPVISIPVSTDGNGNYSESVYSGTIGTYQFDYSDLFNAGVAESVKTECGTAAVSLTTQGQTVTKNTGFWRVYGGWWQATGGSVYANSGVRSDVPASLPAANQYLILGDANGRDGVLTHGFSWTGDELGTNPDVRVSVPLWRIQSTYEGPRYDYDYYLTRMNIFDSAVWDGSTPITYDDGEKGYQILKRTGNATISSLSLTGIQKLIILVDGNVTVEGDIDVPIGAFLAVIAKGSITFNANVTDAQGWFVAETISVPCSDDVLPAGCDKDDTQFEGQGSFVGWTNISLGRDMFTANNFGPSEMFVYRPDFVLNAPAPIKLYTRKFAPFIPDF